MPEYTERGIRMSTPGEEAGTWGDNTNDYTLQQLENMGKGVQAISLTGNYTLTNTNGVTDVDTKHNVLVFSDGGLSSGPTVTLPGSQENVWTVYNSGSTYTITFDAGGTTATLAAGEWGILYTNASSNAFVLNPSSSAATQVGYAEEWASKAEDSLVSVAAGGNGTTEYSARHWSAKSEDWATTTGAQVLSTDYSSKEYAIGDLTASGGSAKAWAIDSSSPNGTSEKSAKTLAAEAAASAISTAADAVSTAADVVTTAGHASDASDDADAAAASAAAAAASAASVNADELAADMLVYAVAA